MVKLRVWMLLWILSLVFASFVDSKKYHRAVHHHGHHRLHRHRQRSKPYQQSIPMKNTFREKNKKFAILYKSIDTTNIANDSTSPWILNKTSTLFPFNGESSDNEVPISGFTDISTALNAALNSSFNKSDSINSSQPPNIFNYPFNFESKASAIIASDGNIGTEEYPFNTRITEEFAGHDFPQSTTSSVMTQKPVEAVINSNISVIASTITQDVVDEREQLVKDLQQLFGVTEHGKNSSDLDTEVSTTLVIRKKRLAMPERVQEAESKKSGATLSDFIGPVILNDPEEAKVQNTSDNIRIRAKRDESELDKALSSIESNYLQDLEDSFAPSALEIQAQKLQESGSFQRKPRNSSPNSDSFKNLTRTKRDANGNENSSQAINDDSMERTSVSESFLKDDNSVTKYLLEDVYPDIRKDIEQPSSMVQLVRTKRFGDGIADHAAFDASYANEVDNDRIVDEPYAEDNRFIDSILSKVDYRSADERNRDDNDMNEVGINANERERTAIEDEGDAFERTRKNSIRTRRGRRRQRKSHKHRAGKHRSKLKHSKIKRVSDAASPRDTKREYNDNIVRARSNENYEDYTISPHDGRRRRGSEVNDNSDTKNFQSSLRTKRDSPLQQLKYYENIHQPNAGQNHSRQNTRQDKFLLNSNPVRSIEEIKQLVDELQAKVEHLHDSVIDDSGSLTQEGSRIAGISDNNTIIVNEAATERLAIIREQRGTTNFGQLKNRTSGTSNAMEYPESCWKQKTPVQRQLQPSSRNSRPARNSRTQRCGNTNKKMHRESHKVRQSRKFHLKWDRWTDWSSCSVTCGRGRQIRWRHCLRNCSIAETEMEEKACQLPACAPGKFLGIFG